MLLFLYYMYHLICTFSVQYSAKIKLKQIFFDNINIVNEKVVYFLIVTEKSLLVQL